MSPTRHRFGGLSVLLLLAAGCDESARPIRLPSENVLGCGPEQAGTVAFFAFEQAPGEPVRDLYGRHDGRLVGAVKTTDGPPGCGQALSFPSDEQGQPDIPHLHIPDAPEWQLAEGAIDFWFRPRACAVDDAGVITRDAKFQERGGHFRVFWRSDCRLAVRIQGFQRDAGAVEGETPTNSEVVTALPLATERWSHFGINFGPPGIELWVNGRAVGFSAYTQGLAGNQNPWSVGVSNDASVEGTGQPLWKPLRDADIDHLRVSNRRLDFSR